MVLHVEDASLLCVVGFVGPALDPWQHGFEALPDGVEAVLESGEAVARLHQLDAVEGEYGGAACLYGGGVELSEAEDGVACCGIMFVGQQVACLVQHGEGGFLGGNLLCGLTAEGD